MAPAERRLRRAAAAAPAVSVCMPARNAAGFVGEALASVLAQTFQDFEVVVCDDASEDDTLDEVRALGERRIRTLRLRRWSGIAAARNACLARARGRYIAWLDADDVYRPEMLERQVALLDRRPDVALAHGAFEVIDPRGRPLPAWPLPFTRDTVERGRAAFAELALLNYVTAPTVVVRRRAHELAGPYAADLGPSSSDWEMWLRIALRGDLAYTSAELASYRQQPASTSALTAASGERLACDAAAIRRVFRRERRLIPDPRRLRRRAGAALAGKALVLAGDVLTRSRSAQARRAAANALRLSPPLARSASAPLLLAALARGDEYAAHVHRRALLARVHHSVRGSRYAQRIEKLVARDPGWERELREAAGTIRAVVPEDSVVGAVDKWDPTLLHAARRSGRHFPDRRSLPDGYPADSNAAIAHLESLRAEGVDHLAVPSPAFWWLDHYDGFREHLDRRYRRVAADSSCIVYALER